MTPREPEPAPDHDEAIEAQETKGRGPARKTRPASGQTVKTKGRTLYIPQGLFERILVQAHRKDKTISEYVVSILERAVPDYRASRAESGRDDEAA